MCVQHQCSFPEQTQQAHGVDSFQALILAIEGIHWVLSRSSQRLSWIAEPGDTGIPRLTPTSFGLAFRQRIERMIDDEIERLGEEWRRRHEKSGRAGVAARQNERLLGAVPDDSAPDLLPTEAVLAHVGALAASDLEAIDQALIAAAGKHFRKVAFLVATAMIQLADRLPPIPDVFYAQRIIRLVKLGQLEAQGDLQRMRFSEVRRPSA